MKKALQHKVYQEISGESADASGVTVESWKKECQSMLKVMLLRIFGTWTRQGVFKALPDCVFAQKDFSCHDRKKSKERITVA